MRELSGWEQEDLDREIASIRNDDYYFDHEALRRERIEQAERAAYADPLPSNPWINKAFGDDMAK